MTPEQLAEIEARAEAATPGVWYWEALGEHGYPQRIGNDAEVAVAETWTDPEWPPANAEFIAHARTDVPDLVAEVRRLRAAVDAALDKWRQHVGVSDEVFPMQSRCICIACDIARALAPVADPDPHTTSDEEKP
jgi:hypothetical protein